MKSFCPPPRCRPKATRAFNSHWTSKIHTLAKPLGLTKVGTIGPRYCEKFTQNTERAKCVYVYFDVPFPVHTSKQNLIANTSTFNCS